MGSSACPRSSRSWCTWRSWRPRTTPSPPSPRWARADRLACPMLSLFPGVRGRREAATPMCTPSLQQCARCVSRRDPAGVAQAGASGHRGPLRLHLHRGPKVDRLPGYRRVPQPAEPGPQVRLARAGGNSSSITIHVSVGWAACDPWRHWKIIAPPPRSLLRKKFGVWKESSVQWLRSLEAALQAGPAGARRSALTWE